MANGWANVASHQIQMNKGKKSKPCFCAQRKSGDKLRKGELCQEAVKKIQDEKSVVGTGCVDKPWAREGLPIDNSGGVSAFGSFFLNQCLQRWWLESSSVFWNEKKSVDKWGYICKTNRLVSGPLKQLQTELQQKPSPI